MMDNTETYETFALNAMKRAAEVDMDSAKYFIGVAQVNATLALAAATEAQTRVMERKLSHVG